MFLNITLLEWVGYLGSVVVAVSLTMSSIKKLRWYNLLGAAIFSFYGFAIGALPVGFLNLFISLADVYYIYKMYSYKEAFQAVFVKSDDNYLHYFIDYHKTEIKQFFPEFSNNAFEPGSDSNFILFLLRDAKVAGVFMGINEKSVLTVHLDFVTAEYRDLKPGDFIYKSNTDLMSAHGITKLVCKTENKTHQKYLAKMGFESKTTSTGLYEKSL